jgi:anaerobic selenocysteine-containing dehydrogenase
MADEIEAGFLRALFVLAGNPLAAIPDSARLARAMRKLDVLAVCDIVPSVTTELATHLLPGVDQLERTDTSNSGFWYSVIAAQYTPAVFTPAHERRPAWWVIAQLGKRLGIDALTAGLDPDRSVDDDVLALGMRGARVTIDELKTADGPVVISGPEYGWVQRYLLPDGRWNLAPEILVDQLASLRSPRAVLALQTGREPRVMNSFLHDTYPHGPHLSVIVVNVDDASAAGVQDGGRVRVTSENGSIEGTARVTSDIRQGAVRVPHSCRAPDVARLTSSLTDVDPHTGMALFVGVPVVIEPVDNAV